MLKSKLKTRTKTLKSAKKKAWDSFSLYIRTRDCLRTTNCASFGLCFTCGKRLHIKLLQAGHLIAGRHNAGLLDEQGVQAQCYNCNINLKGNTLIFRRRINELYGKDTDIIIEDRANQIVQYKIHDWESFKELYDNKLKLLLQSKG